MGGKGRERERLKEKGERERLKEKGERERLKEKGERGSWKRANTRWPYPFMWGKDRGLLVYIQSRWRVGQAGRAATAPTVTLSVMEESYLSNRHPSAPISPPPSPLLIRTKRQPCTPGVEGTRLHRHHSNKT
ncbi:unnamed protein product [Gadus morhua 'NCC']